MIIITTTLADSCCGDGGDFYIVPDNANLDHYKGSCACGRDQIGVFSAEKPSELMKRYHPDAIYHKFAWAKDGREGVAIAMTDSSHDNGYRWDIVDSSHPLFDELISDLVL